MNFLPPWPKLFFTYIDRDYLDYSQLLSLYSLINKNPNFTINIFTSSINLEKNHNIIFRNLNIKPIIFNLDNYLNHSQKVNYQDKITLFKVKYINQNGGIWISLNTLWILNFDNSLSYVNSHYSYLEIFKQVYYNQQDLDLVISEPFSSLESIEEQLKIDRNQNEYFIINRYIFDSWILKKNKDNKNDNKNINREEHIKLIEDFILIGNNQSEVFKLLEKAYLNDIVTYQKIQSNTFQNVIIEYYIKKIIKEKTVNTHFISIEAFNPFYQNLPKLLFEEDLSFNHLIKYFNNTSCIFWNNHNNKINQILKKNY